MKSMSSTSVVVIATSLFRFSGGVRILRISVRLVADPGARATLARRAWVLKIRASIRFLIVNQEIQTRMLDFGAAALRFRFHHCIVGLGALPSEIASTMPANVQQKSCPPAPTPCDLPAGPRPSCALNPAIYINQYSHTAWTAREGFFKGRAKAIAQTPDGYLWLGTEFGLLRFDGVRAVPWQPLGGEQLPSNFISDLPVAHDGTLWIGTLSGLASWRNSTFTHYREVAGADVVSLLEDRQQTIWIGTSEASKKGRLCAIRGGKIEC